MTKGWNTIKVLGKMPRLNEIERMYAGLIAAVRLSEAVYGIHIVASTPSLSQIKTVDF